MPYLSKLLQILSRMDTDYKAECPQIIANKTGAGEVGRGRTDPGAPGRRGRVALERRGAAEEYQPRACVPGRALLPDGRQGRERVPAPAPRPVLLLVHRRVHHRVPRRRPGAGRRSASGRPGRGGERRGGLAAAAAPRRRGVRVGIRLRRHARVRVHRRPPLGFRELGTGSAHELGVLPAPAPRREGRESGGRRGRHPPPELAS
jgi:hypothetical protein